ncbi:MAG: hypothetical protein K2I61_07360, partial [Muribaculaceae bacterium]|nr:hypothetical protein [Muribaculaceae bacterium]
YVLWPDGGRIVKWGRGRWRERGTAPGCLSPQGEFPVRRAEPPGPLPLIFTRPWPFGSFGPSKRTEKERKKEQKNKRQTIKQKKGFSKPEETKSPTRKSPFQNLFRLKKIPTPQRY